MLSNRPSALDIGPIRTAARPLIESLPRARAGFGIFSSNRIGELEAASRAADPAFYRARRIGGGRVVEA